MNPHRICQHLHRVAKSRLALSTVVTTLIVLVVAVLLAGVVTYFAINVTSTRVQEESLALAKQHVWYDHSTGKAQAAIMVINAGGRDVVVSKLTVRGQVCDWSKVFYNLTSESVSGDLSSNSTLVNGGTISVGGSNHIFKQATNDLTVQSGKTLIVYISNPDSISVNDVGLTVSINIFTSQAMYYKETNVQGTGGTQSTSSQDGIDIEYVRIYHTTYSTADVYNIAMVITNYGSDETIALEDITKGGLSLPNAVAIGYNQSIGLQATGNDLPFILNQDSPALVHKLTWVVDSFTLHAGYTAVVYLSGDDDIISSDVGKVFTIGINLDGGGSVTKSAEVEEAQG